MIQNKEWPFSKGSTVCGMKLPDYLAWASARDKASPETMLVLPSIQRGFVWKPKQIIELWDSLLNGMPVGTVMVIRLSENETKIGLNNREMKITPGDAWGLLDGQQRTLAMLMGFPELPDQNHCLWIDLAEKSSAGWQFDIRLTTRAQPYGFNREAGRLSRQERIKARDNYKNAKGEMVENKKDYELFDIGDRPKPWKNGNAACFVKLKELWRAYIFSNGERNNFYIEVDRLFQSSQPSKEITIGVDKDELFDSFENLSALEIPIIRISDKVVAKSAEGTRTEDNPLILLFQRIGRNGTNLSTEDLLFSMIKHQWPDAQRLVDGIINKSEVGSFMNPLDYVMTAFRLAIAEKNKNGESGARPNPKDIHRNLDDLLGSDKEPGPLRGYIEIKKGEEGKLVGAFKLLHEALLYNSESNPSGFHMLLMPHLSRDLVHIMLRWITLRNDGKFNRVEDINRDRLISFSLYWILHVRNESKSSEVAFRILHENKSIGDFPSAKIYSALIGGDPNEFHWALPLQEPKEIEKHLLNNLDYSIFRSFHEIFKNDNKELSKFARESFILFCWNRKHLLLWLQRAYLAKIYPSTDMLAKFAGLTDEETVPYDYDHLCPQSHWGYAWGQVSVDGVPEEAELSFRTKRHEVGNCIGNLHVLDSSLNRSFGDKPFAEKADKEINNADGVTWDPNMDSLCNDVDCWKFESPRVPWRLLGLSQATMAAYSASCPQ